MQERRIIVANTFFLLFSLTRNLVSFSYRKLTGEIPSCLTQLWVRVSLVLLDYQKKKKSKKCYIFEKIIYFFVLLLSALVFKLMLFYCEIYLFSLASKNIFLSTWICVHIFFNSLCDFGKSIWLELSWSFCILRG